MVAKNITNRVSNSKLITIDLEDYYPSGERIALDITRFLFEGVVLREKNFREDVKKYSWEQYQDCYIALTNTSEALIPAWAFMLLTTKLAPYTKLVAVGDLTQLETLIFSEIITTLSFSTYKDKPIIIKGCSTKPIPEAAYIQLIQHLQPIAKSIMYGEACSSVPLFKRQ